MNFRVSLSWPVIGLVLAGAVLIVAAVLEIGPPTSSARTETTLITAENGLVQTTVTGSGNVEPAVDDDADFKTSGTLAAVDVKVGEHVGAGQLLASLEPTSAEIALKQAQVTLASARAQLASAEAAEDSTTTTTSDASDVTALDTAKTVFASEEHAVASPAATTPGATTAPSATTTPSVTTTTTTTTTPTRTTTTPTRTRTTTTRTSTTGASSGGSGARTATGTSSTSGSGTASSTGSGTSSSGSSTNSTNSSGSTANSASTVAADKVAILSDEENVKSAKLALAETKLYAPVSGTIISLEDTSPGAAISSGSSASASSSTASSSDTSTTAGSQASGALGGSSSSTSGSSGSSSSSTGFAEIINSSQLTMTVPFSESDISKVKVGQPATVTLDALTGVELAAKVTAISPLATTSSSVVSYDATLTLTQTNPKVLPGMSAEASVVTDQASGVTLPNDAVTGSGSLSTVSLVKDGKATSQQIVTGLKGDSRTVIVTGLSAGDQVQVTTSLPALGTSASTSSSSSSSSGTLSGTSGGTLQGGSRGFAAGGGGSGGGPPGGP